MCPSADGGAAGSRDFRRQPQDEHGDDRRGPLSRKLKLLALLNVVGWAIVAPVLVGALLHPFIDFSGWPGSTLLGRPSQDAPLADLPRASTTPAPGGRTGAGRAGSAGAGAGETATGAGTPVPGAAIPATGGGSLPGGAGVPAAGLAPRGGAGVTPGASGELVVGANGVVGRGDGDAAAGGFPQTSTPQMPSS